MYAILPDDQAIVQTVLTAFIKSKQFKEAIDFLSKLSDKKPYQFEHAYILHRHGSNKESLQILKQLEEDSIRYNHLVA